MITREVDPAELGRLLGVRQARALQLLVAEEVADAVEQGHRVADVGFWADGDRIEVYARDDVEAGVGVGGWILAEVDTDRPIGRCITCGQPSSDPRPWCSKRCRLALRDYGRRLLPEALDDDAIAGAIRWAVRHRNASVGWSVPIL